MERLKSGEAPYFEIWTGGRGVEGRVGERIAGGAENPRGAFSTEVSRTPTGTHKALVEKNPWRAGADAVAMVLGREVRGWYIVPSSE
jgi:hypothetical protein